MNHAARDADIVAAIRHLLERTPPEKSISPDDVARALAGTDGKAWGPLMGRVRAVLVKLAGDGEIVLLRKGKAVEPGALRGVYRFRRAEAAEPGHAGSPAKPGEPG